jgi:hypothetical protein
MDGVTSLNVDEHVKKYLAMDAWFKMPQGKRVAQAFSEEIAIFSSQLRGETLLQLGHCGENTWLTHLAYQHKWVAAPYAVKQNTTVTTIFNQLPFNRNSIDCIIAPLTIEALSLDKNPMDELDRILKPMGYIIFWGINPLSLWGMALKLGYLPIMGDMRIKLTSVFSVKQVMLDRGYRQCILNTFYYIPPLKLGTYIRELEFLNEMGKMLWIYPAGFYCLILQKHEIISPSLTIDAVADKYLICPDNSLA